MRSIWRTPASVLIVIRKNTPIAITAHFDASPKPKMKMISGSTAILGIG